MWIEFLIKGIIIGFVASIPLGPVGVMTIQKTLSKSRRAGIASGVGAASADLIFASVAAFFISFVMSFIENHINYLKLAGGIVVIIMGVNIFLKNPVIQIRKNRANKGSLWNDYISLFFVTLANPAFILMFVVLFAAFGVSNDGMSHIEGGGLVCGVFIGASTWWTLLTMVVGLFRKKFRPRHLLVINRVSGALIVALGTISILSLFVKSNIENIIL